MSKQFTIIIQNLSSVNQIWQLYPQEPIELESNKHHSYKYLIDTERDISIGLLIDVGESQLATSVRRDKGENSKFYFFPDSNYMAISTYSVTVHIRSTFEGEESGFISIKTESLSDLPIDLIIEQAESKG